MEVLPNHIASDNRFWIAMVKVEMENMAVDLGEYFDGCQPRPKTGTQESWYKNLIITPSRCTPYSPEVDITYEI